MKMRVNDVMIKTPMRDGLDVLQTVLNLMSLCIETSNVNSKKERQWNSPVRVLTKICMVDEWIQT